jgi:hypothetical protein
VLLGNTDCTEVSAVMLAWCALPGPRTRIKSKKKKKKKK